MALATSTTQGEIVLGGDLQGSNDGYLPELSPTGVIPGEYTATNIVVDQKGRVMWVESGFSDSSSVPDATYSSKGKVSVDVDTLVITNGELFLNLIGDIGIKGKVSVSDTNDLNISSGQLYLTNVPARTDDSNQWGNNQVDAYLEVNSVNGNYFPNINQASVYKLHLEGDTTLELPLNITNGDMVTFLISGPITHSITFSSEYKIRSYPVTRRGDDILSGIYLNGSVYAIFQRDFK